MQGGSSGKRGPGGGGLSVDPSVLDGEIGVDPGRISLQYTSPSISKIGETSQEGAVSWCQASVIHFGASSGFRRGNDPKPLPLNAAAPTTLRKGGGGVCLQHVKTDSQPERLSVPA